MNPGCPFCQIAQFELFDFSDGRIMRFEPLKPVTVGHLLFVPIRHADNSASDPVSAGLAFQAAARWGTYRNEQFNLITSTGRNASQSVRHTHVHYVPRMKDDGLYLPWTGSKKN